MSKKVIVIYILTNEITNAKLGKAEECRKLVNNIPKGLIVNNPLYSN